MTVTIHEGDNRVSLRRLIDEGVRVHSVVTDPPYGLTSLTKRPGAKADRAGSKHPTVKPVALMRWLVRLVTPPGGTVLDPFAGSGTTGAAARVTEQPEWSSSCS